jgi:3D (Asp-Asp-Asp) domain-containing protein
MSLTALLAAGVIVVTQMTVTAYSPPTGARTADGTVLDGTYSWRSVACGPKYPFGTVFMFDGYPMVCHDRGSMVGNNHIDFVIINEEMIHCDRRQRLVKWGWCSAIRWGKKARTVCVFENATEFYRKLNDGLIPIECGAPDLDVVLKTQ